MNADILNFQLTFGITQSLVTLECDGKPEGGSMMAERCI